MYRTETNPPSSIRRARARGWVAAPAAALLLLAGCATSKVQNLALATPSAAEAPPSLAVEVALSPEIGGDPKAQESAAALQSALLKEYRKAGVMAVASAGEAPATLHVDIRRVDAGSGAMRMLVGFGAGRSAMQTDATLRLAGANGPAMAFSSTSKSSRKPGLILPGAVAAATGEASRLAIGGGINLLIPGRAGLTNEAHRSAKLIVRQTRDFYRSSGWRWPADGAESA